MHSPDAGIPRQARAGVIGARETARISAGALSLQGLRFGYQPERAVLDEISLQFAAGSFVGIVGQTLVTMGVRQAETSVVLPFDYLRIVYAFFIGLWLFDEVPNAYSAAGTVIIVASTLYILIREARQKKQEKSEQKAGA